MLITRAESRRQTEHELYVCVCMSDYLKKCRGKFCPLSFCTLRSIEDLLTYNFESPFYSGSRLDSLRVMLRVAGLLIGVGSLKTAMRMTTLPYTTPKMAKLPFFWSILGRLMGTTYGH